MKVVVKNFQAIEEAVLLLDGFTVITGRSDIGKSALVRALDGAMFGHPGDHYVRDGHSQTGVALTDAAHKVEWRKGKDGAQTSLKIDGTKHSKLGRGHATLTEALGYRTITVGNDHFKPQVAGQFDPPFLLTDSETTTAEVLKQVARGDVITEAQRRARADGKDTEARLKVRTEDQAQVAKDLQKFSLLGKARATLDAAKSFLERTAVEATDREHTQAEIKELRKLERLWTLPQVPKIPITEEDIGLIAQLKSVNELRATNGFPPLTTAQMGDLFIDTDKLARALGNLGEVTEAATTATAELAQTQQEIQMATESLELLEAERVDLEADLGNCPTCGQPFCDHREQET